jgi:hypothetical protein
MTNIQTVQKPFFNPHGWNGIKAKSHATVPLKVHKIENFFDSDFGICVISLLVMSKY